MDMPISNVLGTVNCESWRQSRKCQKLYVIHGFNVIQGHRIWRQSNGTYVTNSNLGYIGLSHAFRATAT